MSSGLFGRRRNVSRWWNSRNESNQSAETVDNVNIFRIIGRTNEWNADWHSFPLLLWFSAIFFSAIDDFLTFESTRKISSQFQMFSFWLKFPPHEKTMGRKNDMGSNTSLVDQYRKQLGRGDIALRSQQLIRSSSRRSTGEESGHRTTTRNETIAVGKRIRFPLESEHFLLTIGSILCLS